MPEREQETKEEREARLLRERQAKQMIDPLARTGRDGVVYRSYGKNFGDDFIEQ